MRLLPVVVYFLIFSMTIQAQGKQPVLASDLMKITTADQIRISPDGSKALVVVTRKAQRANMEYYYTRHLFVISLSGNDEPRQLTFGDRSDGQPTWSPDGKQIAFVRAEGDKPQVWLLSASGGEAHAITNAEYGAGNPVWSPDGKSIMYSSSIPQYALTGDLPWPYERPARLRNDEPNFRMMSTDERKNTPTGPDGSMEQVREWLAKNASEGNPRVLVRTNLQGELNLQPDESFNHLFLIPVNGERKAVQLTNGFQDFSSATWSPDGKRIVCDSKIYKVHPDRERATDLWTIDVETKQASQLLNWPGHSVSGASFSPDGSIITFNTATVEGGYYAQSMIATATASGQNPQTITTSLNRDVSSPVWSTDGKTIYFIAQSEGDIQLFNVSVKGGTITRLLGNDSGVNDFDIHGDKIVYALTQTRNPWEIFIFNQKDKSEKQLTKWNETWLKNRNIVFPKEYWMTRPDGNRIQYWVMEPAGRKEGIKYPTILNIHGGPSAMWGPGVFSMWHEYQSEASWGYGLVYCNPRGSGGYGDQFKRANFKDWGTGPADDILASLEEAIKNNAWIDPDQLFVEGGSYAGYMVAWIIGHDNRFKAANAQRGVYDLSTFMGEGNAWRLVPDHFGGYPWEKETRALLDANSPINYVNNIQTPLLIIHGDQDLRTGVIQSETLFKSLKILDKPVEYIRYPKEGHELTRGGNPGRMMDHLLRVIEFFDRYTKHPEPPLASEAKN